MKALKNWTVELFPLFVMFCVGMYAVPIQLMHTDLSFLPGDLADGRLNNYFLEHGFKWLSGQTGSFWNAPFFYPIANTMSFSDNHLGTLPIYFVFRLLHFDRETSYQLWFLTVFALNYIACAWVLKKLSLHAVGAAAGAYVFSFSLPVIARTGHSQLMPRFMIPLAFYFAFKFLEKNDKRALMLASLSVVIQFYCTVYMGVFLVLGLAALMAVYVWFYRDQPMLRNILWGSGRDFLIRSAILCGTLLLLLPLMIPYYKTSLVYGLRPWGDIKMMLPRWQSYLTPAYGSFVWNHLSSMATSLPMPWEHQLFIGGIPLLSIIAMPFLYRRYRTERLMQTGMVTFLVLVVLTCLTLYVGKTLYRPLSALPGLRSIRAVSRIMLMNSFLVALILGVVLTKIQESRAVLSRYSGTIVFPIIVSSLVVLDQFSQPPAFMSSSKSDAQKRIHAVESLILNKNPHAEVIAYMPNNAADPPMIIHLDAMLAAQDLNISTVNGYSGNFPHHYYEYLYDNYGKCDSLIKWLAIAEPRYSRQEIVRPNARDVTTVGRDSCVDPKHEYSFVNEKLPDSGFRASITMATDKIVVGSGQEFKIACDVRNTSSTTWASLSDQGGKYGINLSYRWLSSRHTPLGGFDSRAPLPYDLPPGEKAGFAVPVQAPKSPGIYYLEFDMVQELVAWFHEKGSPTALLKVIVL